MVYLDFAAGGETVDEVSAVTAFIGLFDDAQAVALAPDDSAEIILTTIGALEES